jgi:hypothetical protein
LEAGELEIDNDLYERIVEACGWPRGHAATVDSPTLADEEDDPSSTTAWGHGAARSDELGSYWSRSGVAGSGSTRLKR